MKEPVRPTSKHLNEPAPECFIGEDGTIDIQAAIKAGRRERSKTFTQFVRALTHIAWRDPVNALRARRASLGRAARY